MTSLYGYFQYFDDSYLDQTLRMLYFREHPEERDKCESMTFRPSPPAQATVNVERLQDYLEAYHPLFCLALKRGLTDRQLYSDPAPTTLFLLPESYLKEQFKTELSVWACRQLTEKYWVSGEMLDPCFFLRQSAYFKIYNRRHEGVSCQGLCDGRMLIDDRWILDACGASAVFRDETHIVYSLLDIFDKNHNNLTSGSYQENVYC